MKHELKIWPQYFCRIMDGTKTFEVRNNDRGFQAGDTVLLREYNNSDEALITGYTGKAREFTIGYVFPIDEETVVFSLLPPPAV